ncbi:MAG: glycoside hydrolase family 92 protein [Clostridia bacterium]|nr:glycoside hydrolase family 92 protein [Clostridia bacterium]
MTNQNHDYCQYVDVFYGNGETDRFFDDGLAHGWVYIKALCGNTTPHVTLPFGKMSVGAYSGGYPTGYSTHYPNSCGGIRKMGNTHKIKGFSHLHQSGTGGIRYYYNYAVVTPFYGELSSIREGRIPQNETARPGYYKTTLEDISCELTVDGGVALHRYVFGHKGGRVAVDFSNDGLARDFGSRFYGEVREPHLQAVGDDEVLFSGIFSGIRLYFCARVACDSPHVHLSSPYNAVWDFQGDSLLLRMAYSTVSAECAQAALRASIVSFEAAANNAYRIWNRHLSVFRIHTEDTQLQEKFYSNLYHSLIKPCDLTGERVLGVGEDTVTDFATFWDQYKTALPLIYMGYPEMGQKVAKGIIHISRTLGKIPCSFGLSDVFPCEEQAKMLGIYALCDAYHMGIEGATAEVIEECTERELAREDYASFLENGFFERYTHILDVTDACMDVAQITHRAELKKRLLALAAHWKNAYSPDGLMSEKSPYYEGDRYTYSFRLQRNMEERIALAGGKERFAALLDDFFGFGGGEVHPFTLASSEEEVLQNRQHRFQGFNNECDMETPYAYIDANRHDRLCEILHECVTRSFGLGRGGLPGNNDSGGLSSLFIWNTLGIFPVSGSGEFLIGAPQMDGAEITLSSGNTLCIRVERPDPAMIYVDRVEWNGRPVEGFRISAREIMGGGVLGFYMK